MFAILSSLSQKKLEKVVTVDFKKTPCTEGWDKVPGTVDPKVGGRFAFPGAPNLSQERKRHINLRKILGTPAGCPWDTRLGQTGVYQPEPQRFPVVYKRRATIFAGTLARCPRDAQAVQGLQKIYVIFSYGPFLLPT